MNTASRQNQSTDHLRTKKNVEHQPFGWVKAPNGVFLYIDRIFDDGISIIDKRSSCRFKGYLECDYTFLDGTPFGIKEE